MAIKTKAEISIEITSNITDNANKENTAERVREVLNDMNDSYALANADITPNVYKALLTQTSTNAPTEDILVNTIGSIIWTYDSAGVYVGTLVNAFPASRTFKFIEQEDTSGGVVLINRISEDVIHILTNGSNDILSKTSVLIEVYPA
jgi:hypothetical protein